MPCCNRLNIFEAETEEQVQLYGNFCFLEMPVAGNVLSHSPPLFYLSGMLQLRNVHHIAIICSNYQQSKAFYTGVLGLEIIREVYREKRDSYKLDLSLNGNYIIELFSFPYPPPRPSRPEAVGLRHLAFAVDDVVSAVSALESKGITAEPVRTDEFTGKHFTFFSDPDGLPIELYEV